MDDRILKWLSETYPNDTQAAFSKMREYQRIQREKTRVTRELKKIEDDLNDVMRNARLALREVESQCGHEVKQRYPDPSGGNGSYYECLICGAEI